MADNSGGSRASRFLTCVGVGGTGKTTAVEALQKIADVRPMPSIVRSYYASRGVASEADYLRSPPGDRFAFQVGLLDHYTATTEEFLAAADGAAVVADRSAFDHIAYCIYASPELSAAQLEQALSYASRFMRLRPVPVFFPFPVSWAMGAAAEDGFRATHVGKNFAVDAIMRRVLRDYYPYHHVVVDGSPAARAWFLDAVLRGGETP